MPTLTVTLDFASNDGTAEQFVDPGSTNWSDGVYDGTDGDPSGSVRFDLTANVLSDYSEPYWERTFIDWGIPAGVSVISVGNLSAESKTTYVGSASDCWPGVSIQIGHDFSKVIQYRYPNTAPGSSTGWVAVAPLQTDTNQAPYALTDLLAVVLDLSGRTIVGGSEIHQFYDNITFDIVYSAASDVNLDGSITQGGQTVSGAIDVEGVVLRGGATQAAQAVSGTVTLTEVDDRLLGGITQAALRIFGGLSINNEMLIYGGVTQAAQRVDGALYMALTSPEVALPVAGARSVLLLDGTLEVPLLQAQVYRQPAREVATAVVPAAFLADVQAATTLDLRLRRARYDGAGVDDLLLFSGTIDHLKLVLARDRLRVPCIGAASWPARQNRRLLGKPMYQREDEYASTVRGVIDPAVVPGDNLRFGDREVPVTKVVFNLDLHYQFMEASSGF